MGIKERVEVMRGVKEVGWGWFMGVKKRVGVMGDRRGCRWGHWF